MKEVLENAEARQVEAEINQLNHAANSLEEIVERLAGRLMPVTTVAPPVDPASSTVDHEVVPVADAIRVHRYRIQTANNLLDDIIERLEV